MRRTTSYTCITSYFVCPVLNRTSPQNNNNSSSNINNTAKQTAERESVGVVCDVCVVPDRERSWVGTSSSSSSSNRIPVVVLCSGSSSSRSSTSSIDGHTCI